MLPLGCHLRQLHQRVADPDVEIVDEIRRRERRTLIRRIGMLPGNGVERDGIGRIKLIEPKPLLLILPDRGINGIPDRLGIRSLGRSCSPIARVIKPCSQFRSNAKYHRRQRRFGTSALKASAKTWTKAARLGHYCILIAVMVESFELPLQLKRILPFALVPSLTLSRKLPAGDTIYPLSVKLAAVVLASVLTK